MSITTDKVQGEIRQDRGLNVLKTVLLMLVQKQMMP